MGGMSSVANPISVDNSTIEKTGNTIAIKDSGVTSTKILDGTIVNADINSSAAIDGSKLASVGMTLIDSTTLGADTTSVTVTGMTTTVYPMLYCVLIGAKSADADAGDAYLRLNADSGANQYDYARISNGTYGASANQTEIKLWNDISNASSELRADFWINNETALGKIVQGFSNSENVNICQFTGLYKDTSNKLTEVSLSMNAGASKFAAGSKLFVFGMGN